jgi:hypothetical protein
MKKSTENSSLQAVVFNAICFLLQLCMVNTTFFGGIPGAEDELRYSSSESRKWSNQNVLKGGNLYRTKHQNKESCIS